MARTSALQSVDLGFISPSRVIPKDLKKSIHSFLLGAQHKKDSVENKPASLLVVSLSKALDEMPPSLSGRQVVAKQSTCRGNPV